MSHRHKKKVKQRHAMFCLCAKATQCAVQVQHIHNAGHTTLHYKDTVTSPCQNIFSKALDALHKLNEAAR